MNTSIMNAKGRKKIQAEKKKIAFLLREEDPKKWTQERTAALLGVTQGVVSQWFGGGGRGHSITSNNVSPPDARRAVSEEEKAQILERMEAGETQKSIAEDMKISTKTIQRIAALLGVARNTVSDWFHSNNNGHIVGSDNVSTPDARRAIAGEEFESSEVLDDLQNMSNWPQTPPILPKTESQCRELIPVPKEERPAIWEKVVEMAK